jgi:hypothetical protein
MHTMPAPFACRGCERGSLDESSAVPNMAQRGERGALVPAADTLVHWCAGNLSYPKIDES